MTFCFNIPDLLLVYHDLIFKNHGKSLEQLEAEEIEFTSYIVCLGLF